MTEIWALLRPLERIELLMAEIYQALTETHADDTEAARLFGRLSLEERAHVAQVQYVHRMARQSREPFAEVNVDLPDVRQTLEDLESLAGVVRTLKLEDAVSLVLGLENSAAEAHARPALADAGGEMAKLLRGLAQGDATHVKALAEFARSRGIEVPEASVPRPAKTPAPPPPRDGAER